MSNEGTETKPANQISDSLLLAAKELEEDFGWKGLYRIETESGPAIAFELPELPAVVRLEDCDGDVVVTTILCPLTASSGAAPPGISVRRTFVDLAAALERLSRSFRAACYVEDERERRIRVREWFEGAGWTLVDDQEEKGAPDGT